MKIVKLPISTHRRIKDISISTISEMRVVQRESFYNYPKRFVIEIHYINKNRYSPVYYTCFMDL
jgi:hypothetical protein